MASSFTRKNKEVAAKHQNSTGLQHHQGPQISLHSRTMHRYVKSGVARKIIAAQSV